MSFRSLLGNERLKENLEQSLKKGRISHFYLLCGPAGSGKHTLARLLSAAILCLGKNKPCLSCEVCRKVMENTHPDVITVEDPEHKHVAVKIVRQFREDVFIRPNESEHKIYLLPQELGIEGQNALLKILEEPPAYGVFLLLTDNPEKLLPTIRSRCTELKLTALPETILRPALKNAFPEASQEAISAAIARSGGFFGQAKQILEQGLTLPPQTESFALSFAKKDALGLMQTLVPMEKWKRDQLIGVLNQWIELLTGALVCRAGLPAAHPLSADISASRSGAEVKAAIDDLQKCVEYAQGNVSPAAICGYLVWALR
ncbi:MAG: hypothetical protein E7439_07220 [Ruminococcaceae bacterium]|nr:hypothetical protein [Oscillospiraceae bacterium]